MTSDEVVCEAIPFLVCLRARAAGRDASGSRGRRVVPGAVLDVALALKPDAIVLAVYAGNDFISTPYGALLPPLINELPVPSMLGSVAPRTTWLTVNRLGLSELGHGNRGIAGEFALLNSFLQL